MLTPGYLFTPIPNLNIDPTWNIVNSLTAYYNYPENAWSYSSRPSKYSCWMIYGWSSPSFMGNDFCDNIVFVDKDDASGASVKYVSYDATLLLGFGVIATVFTCYLFWFIFGYFFISRYNDDIPPQNLILRCVSPL